MNFTRTKSWSNRWQKIRNAFFNYLSGNRFNCSEVYYSCVVDAAPLFYWQTWGLVNSLIRLAEISPNQIYVHYTLEVDRAFLSRLETLGVNIIAIARLGDGKYCNKIAQLKTAEFISAKCVFLLDTDMLVMRELSAIYTTQAIKGKIVDLANPELSILQTIFNRAGFDRHPAIRLADDGNPTFENNFNGGLYVIPGALVESLGARWHYWADWLIGNLEILTEVNKQAHIDQISFALATHELSLPVADVGREYNYPLHLIADKTSYPAILHYHRNISPTGTLKVERMQDAEFQQAVADANNLLGSSFDNQIFWSFRYQMFAELGSGVGSRGDNLLYKRSLLQNLGIEYSQSILDVGCGDLEVVKTLHLPNYTGIDVSRQAIELARQKRPDLNFILLEPNNYQNIPQADFVICFEVLIHQQSEEDYQNLLDFLVQKTTNRLVVSGYIIEQPHHYTNHMVGFHKSLLDSLNKTQEFSTIEIIGQHSDVKVILAVK